MNSLRSLISNKSKFYLLALCFTGCHQALDVGVHLDYDCPSSYKEPTTLPIIEQLSDKERWWEAYEDQTLSSLIETALQNNQDLFVACSRVLRAKALAGIAMSERFPRVDLHASFDKQQKLLTESDFGLANKDNRVVQQEYRFPFDISYQVDLWGKYYHQQKSQCEKLEATRYDYTALRLTLATEVAQDYFTLRTLDEEIRFLEEAVSIREVLRDINQERADKGLDPYIDASRAELELAIAQQELENSSRLRSLTENSLALLLGKPASCFSLEKGSLPQKNIQPHEGLPSSLLQRRPDIIASIHQVEGALQDIGVAKANFFPQFSLTGALGSVSPTLTSWFAWKSRFWAFAFSCAQVIFDAGRLCQEQREKEALYLESVFTYQKLVTKAFKEVEDALQENLYRLQQVEAQKKAVFYAEDTAYLARNQYNAGLINYLQVADAEKTELENKKLLIRLHGSTYLAKVQLIKALGGGWCQEE